MSGLDSDRLAEELGVIDVLGENGLIGQVIEDFEPRDSQLGMAQLIDEAIALGESRVIEASTGIGKSFAYLVPSLLKSARVIVSTGTRNLQDQLFHKDLPMIRKAIVSRKKIALLKGRSNYCCPYRINKHRAEDRFKSRYMASVFASLAAWAETTEVGDINEFSEIPENDSLWYYATSNADNCLGSECPEIERCFVLKARKKAMDADLLVINHHLFFSDMTIREEGFGEILPQADVLIFDEAHQLPDIASVFYGQQITFRQIEQLCRDVVAAEVSEAGDSRQLRKISDRLSRCAADFRLALQPFSQKAEWERVHNAPKIRQSVDALLEVIDQLVADLESMVSRGKELGLCHRRAQAMAAAFQHFFEPGEDRVSWFETSEKSFRLGISPLDVSDLFRAQMQNLDFSSVFYTSATLSSQNNFDYFRHRLGLGEIDTAAFESPFDYQKQALLYLPGDLPEPSNDRFATDFGELCRRMIELTRGHCFILFTSYRMLRFCAEYLRRKVDYPLLVQGELQRSELLHKFVGSANPVLLGTNSFWEGVDVKGDQLRCVIIDKLPFKSPQDPVYRKRLQRIDAAGGNAFAELQIPEATLSLRQGVGRLIRDVSDRGIVVLCDRRLTSRGYGKSMLDSLPPMPRSDDFEQVRQFAAGIMGGD